MSRWIQRAIVLLAVLSASTSARGQAPVPASAPPAHPPSYALTVWASEKGLPPGDVFSVGQDAEGYLWVGTPTGLLRFDGSRFQPWSAINEKEPLPTVPTHALVGAHDGSLWVGFGGGGGIARIDHGHVTRFGPKEGAPPGVNAMIEDRQGTVWAASRQGVFRFAAGKWALVGAEEGYPVAEAFSLFEDRVGRLWVGTAAGVYRRDKSTFELIDRAADNAQSLAQDASGAIWVTDSSDVVRRLSDRMAPRHDGSVRLPAGGWRLLGDRHGQIWVAAFGGGLMRLAESDHQAPVLQRFAYEHRLAGSPRSLYEDREGNLWVGMRGGLLRLSDSTFDSEIPLDGLTHDGVRTTALGGDGSVWIATGHSLNRFAGGVRTVYNVSQATALYGDRHGAMWVAGGQGVGRMVNGRFVAEPIPIAQPSRIMSLTTDSRDVVWMCSTLKGVMAWDGHTLSRFEERPDVFNRGCGAVLTDRHDRVWFGFQGGGAAVYEKGAFKVFGESDGMVRGLVLGIIEDKNGTVWFSAAGGVSRYQNGGFTPITTANAPLVDLVPVLAADDEGYIWVGVNYGVGVIRFHPREVDRIASNPSHHLEYALYDETDGMQQTPLTWQSGVGAARTPDGRLWVTSGPGIAVLDPRNLPRSRRPPPPHIESVVADGRRIPVDREIALPARTSTLHVEYATVSLSSSSKLRFRYQLEGYDDDWVYADQRRDVTYTNLPSNNYRFRVSTTNDGQWTEAAGWAFSVQPPFYRARWFVTLVALSLTMLLGLAWWLRMRAVRNRYALVFAERARVSREIHDTLLQSLAALGVELEAIATQLDPTQSPVRDEIRRLRRQVGHSLRDARESILELRRDAMKTPDVVDSLREVAERTMRRHGVQVAISVVGRRQTTCSSDVDLQLFRIGQEALTNAIRHGGATQVRMVVTYDKDGVRLSVCDNGCGFAPAEQERARDGGGEHLGLLTMRERAARIRGRLEIISSPGSGTTIETLIPVPAE